LNLVAVYFFLFSLFGGARMQPEEQQRQKFYDTRHIAMPKKNSSSTYAEQRHSLDAMRSSTSDKSATKNVAIEKAASKLR
jgi:hypothetical protein